MFRTSDKKEQTMNPFNKSEIKIKRAFIMVVILTIVSFCGNFIIKFIEFYERDTHRDDQKLEFSLKLLSMQVSVVGSNGWDIYSSIVFRIVIYTPPVAIFYMMIYQMKNYHNF